MFSTTVSLRARTYIGLCVLNQKFMDATQNTVVVLRDVPDIGSTAEISDISDSPGMIYEASPVLLASGVESGACWEEGYGQCTRVWASEHSGCLTLMELNYDDEYLSIQELERLLQKSDDAVILRVREQIERVKSCSLDLDVCPAHEMRIHALAEHVQAARLALLQELPEPGQSPDPELGLTPPRMNWRCLDVYSAAIRTLSIKAVVDRLYSGGGCSDIARTAAGFLWPEASASATGTSGWPADLPPAQVLMRGAALAMALLTLYPNASDVYPGIDCPEDIVARYKDLSRGRLLFDHDVTLASCYYGLIGGLAHADTSASVPGSGDAPLLRSIRALTALVHDVSGDSMNLSALPLKSLLLPLPLADRFPVLPNYLFDLHLLRSASATSGLFTTHSVAPALAAAQSLMACPAGTNTDAAALVLLAMKQADTYPGAVAAVEFTPADIRVYSDLGEPLWRLITDSDALLDSPSLPRPALAMLAAFASTLGPCAPKDAMARVARASMMARQMCAAGPERIDPAIKMICDVARVSPLTRYQEETAALVMNNMKPSGADVQARLEPALRQAMAEALLKREADFLALPEHGGALPTL